MATAILLSSGLPDTFWEDAMLWALYVYNRILPVRKPVEEGVPWLTPQEAFYKDGPPSLRHLHPFGSKVIAFIPKELRGLKGLTEKGTECILVGLHEEMIHAYICYKPSTNTYFTTNRIVVVSSGDERNTSELRHTVFEEPEDNTSSTTSSMSRVPCTSASNGLVGDDVPVEDISKYMVLVGTQHVDNKDGLRYQVSRVTINTRINFIVCFRN